MPFSDEDWIREHARQFVDRLDQAVDCPAKVALLTELFGKDWINVLRRLKDARAKYMDAAYVVERRSRFTS